MHLYLKWEVLIELVSHQGGYPLSLFNSTTMKKRLKVPV